ncbi:MAG: 30S ribosome-binding factor RbfA [Anaerolineales bacterium]|nr:30S ribosome-binding factor RbfA [Anaerolineales bacterium]
MTSEARARRIGDRMLEELAEILQRQAADPRLEGLTVTGVDVDRELGFATIYVTAAATAERRDDILEGLERARGFLRSELARRIPLRSFPQLRFQWDASVDHGAHIDELLDALKREQDEAPSGVDKE